MKKIMSAVVLVFVLLVITACGGNGELQENDRQPVSTQNQQAQQDQNPDTAQNVIDEIGAALDQAQGNNNAVANISGEYYTFGDTINLWDEWELTFIDNITITQALRTPREGESEQVHRIYAGEIVLFPATLTNISGENRPSGFLSNFNIDSPNGERQGFHLLMDVADLMWDHSNPEYSFPDINSSLAANETLEGYVFAVYDGDGDYWIHWPAHLVSIPVRLPVSR